VIAKQKFVLQGFSVPAEKNATREMQKHCNKKQPRAFCGKILLT
jgi:hypothetical protein